MVLMGAQALVAILPTPTPSDPHPNSVQKEQRRMPVSQSLPGRDLTTYFLSYCLRFQLLNNLHRGADCDPSEAQKNQWALFLHFLIGSV